MKKTLLFLKLSFTIFYSYSQLDFYNNLIIDKNASVGQTSNVILMDVDGDDDLDVISSSRNNVNGKIAWQENIDGQGTFGNIKLITDKALNVSTLFTADINGDGIEDLISSSNDNGRIAWYKRDGKGNFSDQNIIIDLKQAKYAFPTDVDGDGDIDVVVSHGCCTISWIENLDGHGNFGADNRIDTLAIGPNYLYLKDIDADGDVDLITIDRSKKQVIWYKNLDGKGDFGNYQVIYDYVPFPFDKKISNFYFEDIDADGDSDIIISTYNNLLWVENADGLGNFTSIPPHILLNSGYGRVSTKDMDNDGDLDLLLVSSSIIRWFENTNGLVNLSRKSYVITDEGYNINGVDIGDMDNDGDLDVVSSSWYNQSNVVWYKNKGNAIDYEDPFPISRYTYNHLQTRLIDIDNDNDLDIVSLIEVDNVLVWYENLDGKGNLSDQKFISRNVSGKLSFADINADGFQDIVASYSYGNNLTWIENFGQGNFSETNIIEAYPHERSKAYPGDIDGDGDIDIVFSINSLNSTDGRIAYVKNLDGLGTFGTEQYILNTGINHLFDIEVKDLDGDNDNDIVFVGTGEYINEKGQIAWIENIDGLGSFGSKIVLYEDSARSIKAVDIDGDNDLDLIVAKAQNEDVTWFENIDGNGNFDNRNIIYETNNLNGSAFLDTVDLDNDGDLDVLSNQQGEVVWYQNIDGAGNFGSKIVITTDSGIVFPGDIDADGKTDLVFSGTFLSWFNNNGMPLSKISGNVILNNDEYGCERVDFGCYNVKVISTNGSETVTTFTGHHPPTDGGIYLQTGYYRILPKQEGNYTTKIEFNNNSHNSNPVTVDNQSGTIETADFCVSDNQVISDLKIMLSPLHDARPGFTNRYKLKVENIGSVKKNGNVVLNFDNTKLNFISATRNSFFNEGSTNQPIFTETGNQISVDFSDLNPFKFISYIFVFEVLPSPQVNIDEVLNFTATINSTSGDTNELDNIFDLNQELTEVYTSNKLMVFEGSQIPIDNADEYLHYTIRFQNILETPISHVEINNFLDQKLDWETLEIEDTSHRYFVEIKNNNQLKFFIPVDFSSNMINEYSSQGYITYKIKPKPDASIGDVFYNSADIYFDYRPPIKTNVVSTTIIADADNDGIADENDDCPEISGSASNNGCPFNLPSTNFLIETRSETCQIQNNGIINISANETLNYNYTLILDGTTINSGSFTKELSLVDLTSGNYTLCLTVEHEIYQQCYELVISEPAGITGRSSLIGKTYSVALSGAKIYFIQVNENTYQLTSENEASEVVFETLLDSEISDIIVKSNKDCQGKFTEQIVLEKEEVSITPNPTKGILFLSSNITRSFGTIQIYDIKGRLLENKEVQFPVNNTIIDFSKYKKGMYLIQITAEDQLIAKKIIKQ